MARKRMNQGVKDSQSRLFQVPGVDHNEELVGVGERGEVCLHRCAAGLQTLQQSLVGFLALTITSTRLIARKQYAMTQGRRSDVDEEVDPCTVVQWRRYDPDKADLSQTPTQRQHSLLGRPTDADEGRRGFSPQIMLAQGD